MNTIQTQARIEIKDVLFPTDFSQAGDAVIPFAAEIVRRFGAKLHVLHVRPPLVNPMTEPATWPVLENAARAEAEAQRQAMLAAFPGFKPEVMIAEGNFWQNLKTAIEKDKIDLIVLGTRGRSGAAKFFLGSQAEEIFREAPCAVPTVGPNAPPAAPRGREFTEILYATDFSLASAHAAMHAISLAQEFQAHLTLLHVIAEEKPGDVVGASELSESAGRLLRRLVPPEADMWCEPHFAVENRAVAESILRVANKRKADLIVLGVRRPSGFPGAATHLPMATAHKIVTRSACPLLTIRG
jgi:nucleotide-binding universal stress UspA family protein